MGFLSSGSTCFSFFYFFHFFIFYFFLLAFLVVVKYLTKSNRRREERVYSRLQVVGVNILHHSREESGLEQEASWAPCIPNKKELIGSGA